MVELLEEEDGVYDDSIDWVRLVDQGGLNRVSNTTFWLLSAMEVDIKAHLAKHDPENFNINDVLKQKLLTNDEVEFHWETLSTNWEEQESRALLSIIIDYYLTIRGYAFASNWMEQYKNSTKRRSRNPKEYEKPYWDHRHQILHQKIMIS